VTENSRKSDIKAVLGSNALQSNVLQ